MQWETVEEDCCSFCCLQKIRRLASGSAIKTVIAPSHSVSADGNDRPSSSSSYYSCSCCSSSILSQQCLSTDADSSECNPKRFRSTMLFRKTNVRNIEWIAFDDCYWIMNRAFWESQERHWIMSRDLVKKCWDSGANYTFKEDESCWLEVHNEPQ